MFLKGSEIVMEVLLEQGVDTVFGYPGGQVLNIYDALYKYQDRIHHVLTADEQGAAHAADGYSRIGKNIGVCISTSGPGVTNLMTGLATAHADSIPMVAITGNVPTELLGTDCFQEVATICLTMPVTKHNFIVKNIDDLADTIREAFRLAKSGRPGPVLVDIPKDVQTATVEYTPQPAVKKDCPPCPSTELLNEAVKLINESKHPILYCGGGVINADCSESVTELAEKADAYAAFSMMGLTAMDSKSPRYLGMSGMHGSYEATTALDKADVIIAAGVRFTDRATGNKNRFAENSKIIHLDIDYAEQRKNINSYLNICGDLEASLKYLTEHIEQKNNLQWHTEVEAMKEVSCTRPKTDKLLPETVLATVNKFAADDTPVATDVGQHQMWTAQYYKFRKPRTFITSGGLGTMGFGLGGAIGACMASGKQTVLITSDGSFGMNLNELATAVSQNLPLVIVIMNNKRLGMIRQWQTRFYGNRFMATIPDRKTDFVKLAEAFGAYGMRAENEADLESAVKKAFELKSTVVIECLTDSNADVLPMIPPNGSADNIMLQ